MALILGFLPLIDAAPLIVADARGFFAAEGLDVRLSREASWATVRDKLAVGALDGAHLLAPMALAASLGVGSEPVPMRASLALNRGGAAVTVSPRAARDPGPLTFSVVFPYSLHDLLLRDWLAGAGLADRARITVSPPARMAGLLAEGAIDGFCAGEPWNAAAVAQGAGQVVTRASDLMPGALDKVFGVTRAWAAAHPDALAALLRALKAAIAWSETSRADLPALLAEPLGLSEDLIAQGLADVVFGNLDSNAGDLVERMVRLGRLPDPAAARAESERVFAPPEN